MSDKITLRPVTAGDLDVWGREFDGPEGRGVHQWFGHQSTADLRRRFAENGLLGPDGGLFSVVEGDVTVGRVKWFPGTWGPADLTDWSLAVGLVPSVRGRGSAPRPSGSLRTTSSSTPEPTVADGGTTRLSTPCSACSGPATWRTERRMPDGADSALKDGVAAPGERPMRAHGSPP
ncbi:hypothetical protein ACFTWS_38485 [Streptomyces sp. NPDC057027]|uniref:hypothetical protein n=1 Tax=Streptomyces sp. NPDC057027 TaxID=3346004 RepID=UPI003626E72C